MPRTVLKFGKQVQDAGLNRDIKGRDRLVEYKQFRFKTPVPWLYPPAGADPPESSCG